MLNERYWAVQSQKTVQTQNDDYSIRVFQHYFYQSISTLARYPSYMA